MLSAGTKQAKGRSHATLPRPKNADSVPFDLDAERYTIGSILLQEDRLSEVAEVIGAEDFHDPVHRDIFRTMLHLRADRRPIDYGLVLLRIRTALGLRDRIP